MRGVTGWGRLATAVLLLLQLLSVHQVQARTKCLGLQEVSPKRYVSSGGATLPFRLGTSGRLTSRLVTSVFAIFLREVLGYPHVEVRSPSINNTSVFEALSSLNNEVSDEPKEFMVNLEVWIPPDLNTIHLMETYDIKECGLIAPPGRFGWFIPKNLFKAGENLDDWTLFKNPRRASVFSLSKENRQLIEESVRVQQHPSQPPNRTYYCQESYCQSGIYTPPWCKGQSCALLIAENTEDTEYVLEDIRKQKMYVEVAWLGEKLVKTAMELERRYREETRRALLYHVQMPSPITLRAEHVSVTFPPCDKYSNITPTFNCHYANIRLVKLAWSKLLFAARPAFEALQKMELSTNDYRDMVVDYLSRGTGGRRDEEELLEEVACDWLRSHNDSWYNNTTSWWLWRPNDDERNELYIGGIFPLSTNLTNSLTAPGIVKGSMMAIHAVNSNDQILRDYKLNLLLDDGKCQPDEVLRIFIDYIRMNRYSKLVGILGPACSDTVEPLAGVSKHFKTMVVSYSAEGSSFSREKYPYFFRTIGENKQYKYVYLKLLQQLQWTRVASLTEDGTKYTEYISHTQDLLQSKGIAFVANRKFPQDWEKEAMKQYLEELKAKNARIIIADVNDKAARALMCEAYHMDMTAYTGWVWFLPHWLSSNWFEVSSDTLSKEKVHCTTQEMKMAINGHFALSHSYFAPDGDMMQENITVGEWRKKYRSESKLNKVDESNYAGYAYDAVWVYAYALDHLMKMNESYLSSIHDENTTKIYVNLIQNINFHGVSGHIQFSSGSSRFTNVNIMQVVDGRLNLIGTYLPNRTSANYGYANGTLNLNESLIRWLNPEGVKPWDGKPEEEICVLQGLAGMLNSNCQTAIIVANCIGISFLIVIVAIAFFIVKHRYDQKAEITKRFLEHYNIDLLSTTTQDKWEIPKDRIVINRKLGEGAFGFVYGGEAYFAEKGWVAVAVKTLKVGSSVDEKLDFLSEAEVMKRFDHKNIVQLLGVCTKAEPVYTVMEFMLYGDLKTFLLARRHLVYEKSREESDEVSSKRLTNMALDVARALSYLAEVKYVHRDVASRNCLVNVNKVVKLGDFGMTRPMCDNDYYRFQRKGMLPVRWMAPESLLLGVFSPHSDVWSYGVLLYEIVTFGSFPFQGYSNLQVLEHVKAGNTLDIPKDIKNNLGELIRSCWNPDPKKRPPASEIVEYLANNPKLISPCLDVPLSSVQMEDTGEISGEIIGNGDCTRRFSIGLRQRSLSHEINEPLLPSPTRFTLTRGGLGEDPQDSLL